MPELGELTRAAVEAAQGDEAVEAFAEEGRTTEASALRGEVEGLTFAESRGVGVRLISGGRLGYAWAADPSLDEVRDAVRRARENAALAEPDEFNVLPVRRADHADPRAVPRGQRRGADRPEGRSSRSSWSGSRSRATPASRRSTSRRSATRSRAWRSPRPPAWTPSTRAPTPGRSSSRSRSRATRRRPGSRTASPARLDELDVGAIADEAVERGARMLGAVKPPTAKVPVDPRPVRRDVVPGGARRRAQRRVGAEGPVALRRRWPGSRSGPSCSRSSTTAPCSTAPAPRRSTTRACRAVAPSSSRAAR